MIVEPAEIVDALLLLCTQQTRRESIPARNQTVRQLRILITQLLQDTVAHGCQAVQQLRTQMADALHEARRIAMARCGTPAEEEHLAYCIREVQLSFEMAEQIATEHATRADIATILIHDLPIFRPFDYGTLE